MSRIFKVGKYYYHDRRRWGKGRPSLGFTDRRAADAAARRWELDFAEGKTPQVVPINLNRLIVHYLRYCEVNNAPSTVYNKRIYVRRFLNFFGRGPITNITKADVEQYIRSRKQVASNVTTNRELGALRHLFNYAVDWGKLEKNPVFGVKLLPEPRKPLNLPSAGEIITWLSWCAENDKLLYDLSIIALNTGLRRGDILKIDGLNIDVTRRVLAVPISKTGAVQYIPLNDAVLEVLKARKKEGPIFDVNSFKRRFRTALVKTNLKFRFHDFRHLFATAALGVVDVRTVQGLLGHAKITTTERYLALLDERQRRAVEGISWR